MLRKMILMAPILFGTLFSHITHAACRLEQAGNNANQAPGVIVTRALSAIPSAIQMPKDITIGTELYRMTARNNKYPIYRINCNNSITVSNYYVKGQFVGGVAPALSSWQGSSLGNVYQTGTEGIGVIILTGPANQTPGVKIYSAEGCYAEYNYSCALYGSKGGDITYVIIKTGEITASSVDLTTMPILETVVGGENSPGSDITVFRPTLVGSITFTQPTCTLAETSKTVNLGEHSASDFTAANSATSWVNASISLINCNYGGAQSYQYNIRQSEWNRTDVTTVSAPITANAIWSLSLTPATRVIDDTNGIMAIASGEDSATGIGIQLSSSNTTLNPMKFTQPTTGTMVSGTNATMTIPFYARYIKTDSTVTAGKANGKLTYLVEYK